MKLTHDEINLLVMCMLLAEETFNDPKEDRSKYFRKERARDRKLLPDLIDKLNHAKSVSVTSGYKYAGRFNWRFYVPDRTTEPRP